MGTGKLQCRNCVLHPPRIVPVPGDALRALQCTVCDLKIKRSKCQLFLREVAFLGLVVSGHGIESDPGKIQVVQDWPPSTCMEEVRSFHGFCSYYGFLVPGFATVCHPITQLTGKGQSLCGQRRCI